MKQLAWFIASGSIMASAFAGVVSACGGSSTDEGLFTSANDGGGDANSPTSTDGATSGDAATGTSSDAAQDAKPEAATNASNPNAITCGNATCDKATEKCCTSLQNGGSTSSACIAPGASCPGVEQTCDEAADCPGNGACCATFTGTPKVACNANGCGAQGYQVCKTNEECGGTATCTEYTCFGVKVSLCQKPQFGCQ